LADETNRASTRINVRICGIKRERSHAGLAKSSGNARHLYVPIEDRSGLGVNFDRPIKLPVAPLISVDQSAYTKVFGPDAIGEASGCYEQTRQN
jgi:hypothetical protein